MIGRHSKNVGRCRRHISATLISECEEAVSRASILRCVWSHVETNVTGSQSAVQAVGGDVVNYTCHILYHGVVSPSMTTSPQDLRVGIPHDVVNMTNGTIRYDVTTTSVRVPDGPATVPAYTCSVFDWNAHWSSVYFWKSTPITVSCEHHALLDSVQTRLCILLLSHVK